MKILNWLKKHWILSLFLLIGSVPAGLNYSGFCWAEKRWLSDEEMIRNSVSNLLHYYNVIGSNKIYIDNAYYDTTNLSDSTVDEFIKNNPECCHISRDKDALFREALPYTGVGIQLPSIQDSLFGWYRYSVSIRYNKRYIDFDKSIKEIKDVAFIIMTNCGAQYEP